MFLRANRPARSEATQPDSSWARGRVAPESGQGEKRSDDRSPGGWPTLAVPLKRVAHPCAFFAQGWDSMLLTLWLRMGGPLKPSFGLNGVVPSTLSFIDRGRRDADFQPQRHAPSRMRSFIMFSFGGLYPYTNSADADRIGEVQLIWERMSTDSWTRRWQPLR
jgi:hypothetical protein